MPAVGELAKRGVAALLRAALLVQQQQPALSLLHKKAVVSAQ